MEYDVCVREVSYYNVFVEANSKKEAAALAKAMVDHREVQHLIASQSKQKKEMRRRFFLPRPQKRKPRRKLLRVKRRRD